MRDIGRFGGLKACKAGKQGETEGGSYEIIQLSKEEGEVGGNDEDEKGGCGGLDEERVFCCEMKEREKSAVSVKVGHVGEWGGDRRRGCREWRWRGIVCVNKEEYE